MPLWIAQRTRTTVHRVNQASIKYPRGLTPHQNNTRFLTKFLKRESQKVVFKCEDGRENKRHNGAWRNHWAVGQDGEFFFVFRDVRTRKGRLGDARVGWVCDVWFASFNNV